MPDYLAGRGIRTYGGRPEPRKATLSIELPAAEKAALIAEAARVGLSQAQVTRRALRRYLALPENQR